MGQTVSAAILDTARSCGSWSGACCSSRYASRVPFVIPDGGMKSPRVVPIVSTSVDDASDPSRPPVDKVTLTRKLADRLDGIDVSGYHEGDVLDLPRPQAELLIAEQWAVPCKRRSAPQARPRDIDSPEEPSDR